MELKELEIHEVFTTLKKGDTLFSGVFDSKDYPYSPAPPVRCNYFSTVMFTKGSGFIVIDNLEYEVKPNRIFVFSDRQVIGWSHYENTIGLIIAFTSHIALSLHIHFDKPCLDIPESESRLYKEIYGNCIHEFTRNDRLSQSIIQSAIGYLYTLFNRKADSTDANDNIITSFRNAVCRDFSVNITVDDIASQLNIQQRVLNERCLNRIGITAKQYILDLKLTEAKRLLAFTDLNASQIASKTSFEDPSYFTRIFKKKTGLTPSAFKKKYQRQSKKS